ncbi:MAG: hypothetical protein KM310_00710 [Clostridiales bacterium]|nr:hypothetical protein [Clostridiales bacterium]
MRTVWVFLLLLLLIVGAVGSGITAANDVPVTYAGVAQRPVPQAAVIGACNTSVYDPDQHHEVWVVKERFQPRPTEEIYRFSPNDSIWLTGRGFPQGACFDWYIQGVIVIKLLGRTVVIPLPIFMAQGSLNVGLGVFSIHVGNVPRQQFTYGLYVSRAGNPVLVQLFTVR